MSSQARYGAGPAAPDAGGGAAGGTVISPTLPPQARRPVAERTRQGR
jgi:hypothetical protein